jgi:hypothetical protein
MPYLAPGRYRYTVKHDDFNDNFRRWLLGQAKNAGFEISGP